LKSSDCFTPHADALSAGRVPLGCQRLFSVSGLKNEPHSRDHLTGHVHLDGSIGLEPAAFRQDKEAEARWFAMYYSGALPSVPAARASVAADDKAALYASVEAF